MGVSLYEKQGVLEDADSDRRDGADGTDHHAGSIQLYVKEELGGEDPLSFFIPAVPSAY